MKKNYYKSTPLKWRKLGDSLLGVSTFITGFAYYNNNDTVMIIAISIGVIGKFLTNFFKCLAIIFGNIMMGMVLIMFISVRI